MDLDVKGEGLPGPRELHEGDFQLFLMKAFESALVAYLILFNCIYVMDINELFLSKVYDKQLSTKMHMFRTPILAGKQGVLGCSILLQLSTAMP